MEANKWNWILEDSWSDEAEGRLFIHILFKYAHLLNCL